MINLPEFQIEILPEWLDYNGHMNVAYYVLAFDQATDVFYESLGIGLDYVQRGMSVFTLGMNVDYMREMFSGQTAVIRTQLLDVDHKRLHYIHQMFEKESGELAAINECLCMNVDMQETRSAPFPAVTQANLSSILALHQQLPRPPQAGRTLAIRR